MAFNLILFRHELLNGAENVEIEGKAPPTNTRGHYAYYNNFHNGKDKA